VIDEINCYLVGFRRGNGDLFRFDNHTLPNGVEGNPLGFNSNYDDMCEHVVKYVRLSLIHSLLFF
jgi:hypothetical protein